MERRRTATTTGLYDSFCHIFSFYTVSHYTYLCLKKSLNDEERGGSCLLVPERSYGPASTLMSITDYIPPPYNTVFTYICRSFHEKSWAWRCAWRSHCPERDLRRQETWSSSSRRDGCRWNSSPASRLCSSVAGTWISLLHLRDLTSGLSCSAPYQRRASSVARSSSYNVHIRPTK